MWTSKEPSSRLQRGGWVRSEVGEETTLFRTHWKESCSCLEPASLLDDPAYKKLTKDPTETVEIKLPS